MPMLLKHVFGEPCFFKCPPQLLPQYCERGMGSNPRLSPRTTRETPGEDEQKAQQQTPGGGSGPVLLGLGFLREEIIGLSIEHQDSNKA